MKRVRNPRYAPEFLERKLCPSGFAAHSDAAALRSTPDPAASPDYSPATQIPVGDPTDGAVAPAAFAVGGPLAADAAAVGFAAAALNAGSSLGAAFGDDPALSGATDSTLASDPETDPGSDPDDPEPPADPDPGRPPYVPLPPAPVGPAGPALSF